MSQDKWVGRAGQAERPLMPGTRPQLIHPEPWSRLAPGSTLRPPEGWFRALRGSAPGRQLLRCRGHGHLLSEALFQGGSAGWEPAGGGVPWTPSGGLCQWVGRTRLELLGPQRQKDGAGPKEEAGPECGRARGGGRGQAGRGPEDLRPLPPELLPAPAQGAGALQARVVSEPGALGPVPLLPAEQVRGTRRGADSAPWVRSEPPWASGSLAPRSCFLWGCSSHAVPGAGHAASRAQPPRFRVSCRKIIAHKMFDHVVLAFIFLNCITIALERPDIDPSSTVRRPSGPGGGGAAERCRPLSPACPCRSVSSSASPTTSSRRFLWLR